MIGNGHIGVHRSLTRPFIDGWVKRRELLYIVPDGLENRHDYGVGCNLVGGQTDIVGNEAGVLHYGWSSSCLDAARIVTGDGMSQALLSFRRAINREMTHSNGRI